MVAGDYRKVGGMCAYMLLGKIRRTSIKPLQVNLRLRLMTHVAYFARRGAIVIFNYHGRLVGWFVVICHHVGAGVVRFTVTFLGL